jgi:hypothetical protein
MLRKPRSWVEIEESEDYKSLDPEKRLRLLDRWSSSVQQYGTATGALARDYNVSKLNEFRTQKTQEINSLLTPPEQPSLGKVISDQFLSGTRAWDQGLTAVSAASGLTDVDEAAQKISESERANQNVAQTEDMKKFQEAEGFVESAKQILTNPIDVALPLFAQSMGSQITPMIAGSAAGAAVGSVTGPGAAVTGLIGAGVGSGVGDAVVSFPDFIREKGYDLSDPEQVKAALNDPDVVAEAAKKSAARGLIVGATSAVGGAVAGKATAAGVAAAAGKSVGQRALTIGGASTADVAIQTGLEGLGEAGAQLASTGKLSPKDIAAEMFVQTPGQLAEVAIGTAARIKEVAPQTSAELEKKGIVKAQEAAIAAQNLDDLATDPKVQKVMESTTPPDSEERIDEQIDLLEEQVGLGSEGQQDSAAQLPQTQERPTPPTLLETTALPSQRTVTQTLPDVSVSALGVAGDQPLAEPAQAPAPEPTQAPGRYTPEGLAALSNEELAADETELSLAVNREATAATQPSEGARGQQQAQQLAEVSQEALNRVRAERQRRAGATVTDQSAPPEQTPAPAPQPQQPVAANAPAEPTPIQRITGPKRAANVSDETARKIQNREPLTGDEFGRAAVSFEFGDAIREYFPSGEGAVWVGREESERLGAQRNAGIAATSRRIDENIAAQQRAAATPPAPALLPPPQQPSQPPAPTVNVLPTGTDAALPPQRMAPQQLSDDTATAPVVDETGDVFSGVQGRPAVTATSATALPPAAPARPTATTSKPAAVETAPAPTPPAAVTTVPLTATETAPAPAPASAPSPAAPPVAPAPTPDAQTFEDSLVEEARSAGTNVTGRTSLEIKEAVKGKGWYPKTNINKVVAEIKDRVRQRREAEVATPTPAPALTSGPAPATPETAAQALPEPARQLIQENRNKGAVPTSATINTRFADAPVEQRQAIRREAVRQVAQDFGIAYSDDLDFNPDFDGNASIPVRVSATGTEPVFVNNPTVTAKQIDAGFTPVVPENQRASVAKGIEFDPDTGRVASAFARGVTVTRPGQLESAVKAQRPGTRVERSLTKDADIEREDAAMKTFTDEDKAEYEIVRQRLENMVPRSPQIAARFEQADMVAKAISKWAHQRALDKRRAKGERKNYTASQVWNFTMKDAGEDLKTLPMQVSLDAPVNETSGATRGENLADEADTDADTDTEDRGAFSAAAEEADSIEEGVARDEVTEGGTATTDRSGTGMTYSQAFNIVNNPRVRGQVGKGKTARNLRAEAQELLAAAEPMVETLDNDDVDYWDFKIEDFQNVDVGNPGTIISSSRQAKSPYIDQQRSWFEDVARAMGVRRASALTPEQHGTLARYFAEKYRPFFEDGNTTLPVDAVGQDLPELQARMAATDGAASEYRAVIDKLKAEFPGARVVFSASQNATAWYHPRYRDTIFVNPLLLEQELNGLTDSEATPFIRALMQEEYIHMAESQNIPREWVMAISQRLDDRVRQRVIDEYVAADMFDDPAERQAVIDSLDDYAIGSEYLRMLMQRMQSGRSTEDLSPQNLPQDILQRIMEMLQAVVRRLRAQLEVARDPVLAHTIRAIEAGTRKLAIQAEVNQLSPQDRATLVNDLATARDLFARPRAATTQSKSQSPNYAEEAAKVKPGKSYWINAEGRVIDVVAEDTDGKSATHGRYVRNWVDARIGKFFPGESEKETARRIETRARELMTQDPSLREELDQEAIELAYQEAVDLAEVLDQPVPDIDDFRADAARRLGPSDMAYNEAAIEAGWVRIAVPGKFSAEAPIQVQTRKGAVSSRTNSTINELKSLRNISVVEDGAITNKAVNRSDVGRMLQFIRSLPEPPTGPRFARPGNRIRGRRVGAPVRGKGGLWSNIKAIVTGDFSATKSQTGGWFSSGKLTPFERDIVQKPRQKIASEAAAAEFTIQEFRRAIKATYGKSPVPTETINRALGSTENPLTDTQMAELRKIRNKEEREAKKAEFKSLNRDAARADRATALGELPPKVASALSRMRDKIDSLSRRMIEGGYIPDTLVPVFDENMDIYLHREYLIFQNPEWKENMLNPKTEEQARIRSAAERLFVDRAVAEEAVRLRRIAKEQGQPISKDEAKKRAKASTDVIARRANDLALEYLSVADENSRMFFMGTLPPGKRNLSIIKVRGQIPKEIRAFWGEINDAETNFAQTVAKMSAFMAQHDAATELLQHGIENGYIWKRDQDNRSVFNGEARKWDVILAGQRQTGFATKEDAEKWRLAELPKVQDKLQSVAPPAGYTHLIKPGSANPKAIEPLNDAYGPPELAEALAQMVTPRESSGFYRGVSFLTAMFMAMKTVGYFPQAYVRNFLSNPFGQLISGGINAQNWGNMLSALREGTRVARLNSGLRGAMDKVGPTQELREKLLRLGVLSDNPRGTMLKDLYEKGIEGQAIQELLNRKDFKTFGEKLGVKAVQTADKAFQKMADIYNGIDDQWKTFGWIMEVQNQRRAHPDWTQDRVEQKAAENIRDMVWTYSMSPEITKNVRRIPVLAPFITWTSEVIRATSNAVAIANEEMRVGKETGNKAMYRNGINRRAGQIAAFTALPALALAMRSMLGYDEEDEEAVRSTLPQWQKNAQIVLLGQSDEGKQVFVDLSYLDPLQVFKEPAIAMLRAIRGGDNPFDVAAAGFTEALKPVFSEQLFAGAMFDIARNTTADGRRIWNPTDTASNKTSAMIWHVIEKGGPGLAVGTVPRIYKAATGTVSPSGRSFNLGAELAAPVTGQRIQEVDAQTSLRQAVTRFKSLDADSTQLLSNYMTSRGTVNPGDIPAAYDNANRAKREAFEELAKVYNSALRLGTPENIARQTLMGVGRDMGLSREDAAMIIRGGYLNWRPSRQMFDLALTREGGRERIKALMDHLREVNQQERN